MSDDDLLEAIKELFPDCRVYTDAEVAAVLYQGKTRSFQVKLDSAPTPLCYRGAKNRRLMTPEHILRTLKWLQSPRND